MITLYARQQKRHRCIEQYFFIHSSVNGHLGCSHVLAIVNSAALNIGVQGGFFSYGFLRVNAQYWGCWVI